VSSTCLSSAGDDLGALACVRSSDVSARCGPWHRAAVASIAFCSLERRLPLSSGGRELVGLEHPLEHLILEGLIRDLREADFLLDRVVF